MTMNLSVMAIMALMLYSAGCIAYVYRWRGHTRYATFNQYLRKSWPVFAPLNCMLYMATRASARKPVLDASYVKNISILRDNWQTIRDEAILLQSSSIFESIKTPGAAGYYDIGFRTFYKRGWSKFYLKWYGTIHQSAQRLCPKTVALLQQVPELRGAMFSLLPAGAALSLHSDPMACSLRYHLGLATPNTTDCNITIDGQTCSWYDGQDFIFDETYPHQAHNNTGMPRLILMCDVDRPMNLPGRVFNFCYRIIVKGTVVPNTTEDRRGLLTIVFASVAPLRARALQLRQQRRRTYTALKFSLNASILGVVIAMLFGMLHLIEVMLT